ncbi:MAG: hypothetical protein JWP08_2499, partial [Bryobacterales bacterium]|nr:hypothetical protein [Bryobacterales bacterium]
MRLRPVLSLERKVQIFDGFVDFRGVLVTDRDSVNFGHIHGVFQRCVTIRATCEFAFAYELHAHDSSALAANFVHLRLYTIHIAGVVGVMLRRRIHLCTFMIHA